jgi:hypothetical protein
LKFASSIGLLVSGVELLVSSWLHGCCTIVCLEIASRLAGSGGCIGLVKLMLLMAINVRRCGIRLLLLDYAGCANICTRQNGWLDASAGWQIDRCPIRLLQFLRGHRILLTGHRGNDVADAANARVADAIVPTNFRCQHRDYGGNLLASNNQIH